MLTYQRVYDTISDSMFNICRHLDVKPYRPIKRYFGISIHEYMHDVLLKVDTEKFRIDNYGRKGEWIITHQYWRQLATIKDSGLPIELLLHHSMWLPRPILKAWNGADCLNRDDYIRLNSYLKGFDRVYRALFVKRDKQIQKFNEINRLSLSLLKKVHPTATIRDIKLLFNQYNHEVKYISRQFYYTDLSYIN